MTKFGPLDRALVDYCESLERPMRKALGVDEVELSEKVKLDKMATLRITIGAQATKIEPVRNRAGFSEGLLEEGVRAGVFQTPNLYGLESALRHQMSSVGYPISIEVEFLTADCMAKCTGLGFAGLHLDQRQIGFEDKRGLFEFDGPLGCHVTGLDRIAEVMADIEDMVEWDSALPMMLWDIWEGTGVPTGCFEEPVYALTELEAFLKHAVFTRGLEATLERLAAGDLDGVLGSSDLSFMGRRVSGFDEDPHGHVLTLADIANEAAQKVVQNLPPRL